MIQTLVKAKPIVFSRHAGALVFAILIGLGASWRIPLPFSPVPLTGQTLFLMFGAAVLTRHYALEMIAWYLAFGILGVPFFAGQGSGLAYLLGPTGGYLFGFIITAGVIGYCIPFCEKSRVQQFFLILIAGQLLFIPGIYWLKISLQLTWAEAVVKGFLPFIVGDLLKVVLAYASYFSVSVKK